MKKSTRCSSSCPDRVPHIPEVTVTQTDADAALEKRRKLAEMLRQRAAAPKDASLSLGQERLYRLARLNPDVPLYNVATAYRVRGALDVDALDRAVRRIEARHEILRTTFPAVDGAPVQRIAPTGTRGAVVARIDIAAQDIDAAVTREISLRFDLAEGPLWRLAVLRVGPDDHVLTLTMHHIVTDGWSYELIAKELAAFYAAEGQGANAAPDPLPIQYAAFADKQRAGLTGPGYEAQQTYWADRLSGDIPALRLPIDRPGPAGREAESHFFALPADLSAALSTLSQREGASLFMTLLAGFEALLNRSTGQEDLLLCTPVTGRHRAGSRDLIGYFNNILPMRLDVSGDPSLLGLLRRTRATSLEAFKNQDVPFQKNADLPALRRIPLSRLLFSLDMEWPPKLLLAGLDCDGIATDTGAADFDLSVSLWLADGRIAGNLRFKPSLFDKASVAALAQGLEVILTAMAQDPARRLGGLPRPACARLSPSPASPEGETPVAAAGRVADPAAALPRYALEMRLARLWEDAFERAPIGIRDDLQSLSVSSLAVAALAERIQTAFQTDIAVTEIFQAGTVERMAALLQARDAELARSPLAPIQPKGTKPPLFLCEGVGIYYPLAPHLGPDQPIYGLITETSESFPRVEDLAAHYVTALREIQPEGPYHLGGISFGGLVAFEMAQQLRAAGQETALLALMDTPGAGAFRPKPPFRRALGHAGNLMRHGLPYLRLKLGARAPGPGRMAGTGMPGGGSGAGEAGIRGLFQRSADAYAIRAYRGRITLFTLARRGAMSDSLVDPALAYVDPLLGWGAVASDGVERHELDGEHVTILREPYVRALADRLRDALARAGERTHDAADLPPAPILAP
jgi:thioesterase domain-containing protein